MPKIKVLSRRKGYDGLIWPMSEGTEDNIRNLDELQELGEDFVLDKQTLETLIETVEQSDISREHKIEQLKILREILIQLQEQYDESVAEKQQEIQEQEQETIDQMQQYSDELNRQADSLRDVKMEAAQVDTSAAADAADEQKAEIDQERKKRMAVLLKFRETQERQREQIMGNYMEDR